LKICFSNKVAPGAIDCCLPRKAPDLWGFCYLSWLPSPRVNRITGLVERVLLLAWSPMPPVPLEPPFPTDVIVVVRFLSPLTTHLSAYLVLLSTTFFKPGLAASNYPLRASNLRGRPNPATQGHLKTGHR
jgi:hypothetical protein